MKRYLVVADGYYFGSYGTEMYLLGDFSSKELAEECVKNNTKKDPKPDKHGKSYDLVPRIIEVDSDKTYPLIKDDNGYFDEYTTDVYLGGYCE